MVIEFFLFQVGKILKQRKRKLCSFCLFFYVKWDFIFGITRRSEKLNKPEKMFVSKRHELLRNLHSTKLTGRNSELFIKKCLLLNSLHQIMQKKKQGENLLNFIKIQISSKSSLIWLKDI